MNAISPLRRTVGLVLIMIGGFWIAISLGFLEESFMTGQRAYTVVGVIVALAGVLVLAIRPKAPPPAAGEADSSSPEASSPDASSPA